MIRKRIASVTVGTAAGQIFQFAALFYLARLLSPADFGPYSLFMGLLAITTSTGALRYELAFGLVERRSSLLSILILVVTLAVAIGLVSGLLASAILVLFPLQEARIWLAHPALFGSLVWAGTCSLIIGEALPYLALRFGSHVPVARYAFVRPVSVAAMQLALVLCTPLSSAVALIGGAVLGQCVALLSYSRVLKTRTNPHRLRREVKENLQRFSYLAWTQAPQQIFSRLGLNSLAIVYPLCFGATWAGWFSVVNRILCTPSQVLGKALRTVLYSDGARRTRSASHDLQRFHRKATLLMTVAGLFFFLPVGALSEPMLLYGLGEQWVGAAPLLTMLSFFWLSAMANIPSSVLIAPLGLDRWYVAYEGLLLLARLLGALAAILIKAPLLLAVTFSAIGLIFNAVLVHKVSARISEVAANEAA